MIRLANDSDLDAISKIENDCLDCPWTKEIIKKTIADNDYIFFVYFDSITRQICGYGSCHKIMTTGEIGNIAVSKNYRRKGIAKKILQHIIDNCNQDNMEEIFLEVNENNSPAIKLYANAGFVNISIRERYYKNASAIIMKKELKNSKLIKHKTT